MVSYGDAVVRGGTGVLQRFHYCPLMICKPLTFKALRQLLLILCSTYTFLIFVFVSLSLFLCFPPSLVPGCSAFLCLLTFNPYLNCFMWFAILFSHSVVSDCLLLHGLQHARLPSPSLSPWVKLMSIELLPSNHLVLVVLFSCLQYLPASGGQSIGA